MFRVMNALCIVFSFIPTLTSNYIFPQLLELPVQYIEIGFFSLLQILLLNLAERHCPVMSIAVEGGTSTEF